MQEPPDPDVTTLPHAYENMATAFVFVLNPGFWVKKSINSAVHFFFSYSDDGNSVILG
jgi:hypothetical protein